MTDNIDHAAEARWLISDETLEGTLEGEESEVYAAAQAHATLALVAATEKVAEQARIANLIALATTHPRLGEEWDVPMHDLVAEAQHALAGWEASGGNSVTGPDEYPVIREDVREGLGL